MEQFPSDCLPPEAIYPSRDNLFQAINGWAKPRGYAFTTARSSKARSGLLTITYVCDRGCKKPSRSTDHERLRNTTTKSTNCPFSVIASQLSGELGWAVRHRTETRFATHNHAPSFSPTAHPIHRKLNTQQRETVTKLQAAGIKPQEIQTYLRQDGPTLATQRDILNILQEIRRESRQGQPSIHALQQQLEEKGYWSRT